MRTNLSRRTFVKLMAGSGAAALTPSLFAAKGIVWGDDFLPKRQFVVGHRGACAYAPENTLESYRLAIKQGVEYVEQDLQISKDGVLVCCHDVLLNRVTNAAAVFPDRFREETIKGKKQKNWYIHDFTVAELKQLDAGSAFNPKFKNARIPTWQEAIDEIRGKAGLCPETKGPEYYGKLGFNMEALVMEQLKKNGLDKPRAHNPTPLLIQSFSKDGLKKMISDYDLKWPTLWLTFKDAKWSPATFAEAQKFAKVVGPYKGDVTADFVKQAHAHGLRVVPFTFRVGDEKGFKDVGTEMRHYIQELKVDGMFTDNPDLFPR